jgi:hypothetical protein
MTDSKTPSSKTGFVSLAIIGALAGIALLAAGTGIAIAYSKTPDKAVQNIVNIILKNSGQKPERIFQHEYKGQKVFLAEMPCCDQFNPLFTEKGDAICSPTGGFAGSGDGKCRDFEKEKSKGTLVWESTSFNK